MKRTTRAAQPSRAVDEHRDGDRLGEDMNEPIVALPEPGLSMTQDAEWCVVQVDDEWRQIGFHAYDDIYQIPGLYEKVIYDILGCNSPRIVCQLLREHLREGAISPSGVRVFDLGAGNGMVGDELSTIGAEAIVGVDIIQEAADACERDRPGVYHAYHVLDMTQLSDDEHEMLRGYRFNTLTCVAALGFGDIPTRAFGAAYNLVSPGGCIAFNIKEDFLSEKDESGFGSMIRDIQKKGLMSVLRKHRYRHRLATNGDPLYYYAIVAKKERDIPLATLTE